MPDLAALCIVQVCVEVVGYLLEELRDPTNFAAFQKDMEDANVFIGSLIFIEELAEKVSYPGVISDGSLMWPAARCAGCSVCLLRTELCVVSHKCTPIVHGG